MKTIKFDKQFNQLILDGTKTQTRRPMKTDTSKYKKGDVVLIEGTDIKIEIKQVRDDKLQVLSPKDVSEELGTIINKNAISVEDFTNMLIKFKNIWDKFYGDTEWKFDNDPYVWVYEFEVED